MKTALPLFSVVFLFFFFTTSPTALAGENEWLSWGDSEDLEELVLESVNITVGNKLDPVDSRGFYLNVLQDCWTTDVEEWYIDPEMELYSFPAGMPIVHVWKHKIFQNCSRYLATLVWTECIDGKPTIAGNIRAMVPDIGLEVNPGHELILGVTISGLSPGNYDWFVVTECNDTNGTIGIPSDGDIDDVIGANLGFPPNNPIGPCVMGPEPVRILDPDPGGYPPGRRAGEEGATRCWCFEVR